MKMGQEYKPKWIVVRTQANREMWACENIFKQGYEFYIPKIATRIKVKGQTIIVPKPLFSRYVFVRIEGTWRFLMSTFGVLGVVLDGEQPATMPDEAIQKMRVREDQNGLIVLPKPPLTGLEKGQRVRVIGGSFKGKTGIYQGTTSSHREKILLDFLGRKTPVLIDNEDLEEE